MKYAMALVALLCGIPAEVVAQVSGKVLDPLTEDPISQVNIVVVGTERGFVSGADGRFEVKGQTFPLVLHFSAVGYRPMIMTFGEPQEGVVIEMSPIRLTGEEVMVRSGRIVGASENKNPIPVTTISYDELRTKQNTTAADLLRAETGVYVQQTTPGQGSIYVRGRAGRDVLYLFNGLRMNPSFVRSGQNQYFGSVDPFSIDQIEVFRGPISTFYGSDALSGGVNVVPRIAEPTMTPTWSGRLQSQFNLGGNGEKTLHGGIGKSSKAWSYAVGGTYRDFSHYTMSTKVDEGLYFPYGRKLTEADFSFHSYNGSMRWSASDRTSVEALFYRSVIPDAPRWDRMIVGYSGSDSPARYYDSNTSPLTFTAAQVEVIHTTARAWANNMRLHVGYHQLLDHRRSVRFDDAPSSRTKDASGLPSDLETRDNNTSDQFHLSADFRTLLGPSTLLTWGTDLSYDRTGSEQYLRNIQTSGRTRLLPRFPDGSEYVQSGLFAHVYHGGLSRWTIEGGVRFSSALAVLPMEGVATERSFDPYSQRFSQLTGSAGASYQVAANTFLVGNLGTGFRAPNVADLSEVGIRRSDLYQTANPDLKPEQSVNLDVGLRSGSNRLKTEISGFVIHYFDKIDVQYTGEVVDQRGRRVTDGRMPQPGSELYFESVSANASSMNLVGLETSIHAGLSDLLQSGLIANYAYGRIRNSDGVRDYVDRIPPANGLLYVELSASKNRLRVRPQARFALAKRTLSVEEAGDDRISSDGTDGFVNFQLISTFDVSQSVQFRVFADNLANSAYREHASTLDGMQRNVTFSIHYVF